MKRTKLITILCAVIMFFITASPAFAEDMMDNLLPQDTNKKQEGKVHLEYNEYPMSRYGMDTHLEQEEMSDLMPWGWDEGVGKQIDQGMSMLNSTFWGMNKLLAGAVGVLVSESFNFQIIKDFADDISKAIKDIAGFGPGGFQSNGLWPYLVTFIIVMVGVWAFYIGFIKRASSVALGGILTSILYMALALSFFTNSDDILTGINEGVSEVQNDVLSFSISATTPGAYNESEGIATMRNQIFNLMVKYPYLLMQFGTTDEDKIEAEWNKSGSRVDAILKTGVFSKERQEAIKYEVEELDNENMKPESLTNRFVILILSLIMNSIMGTILLLLAGSSIFYQILVLVFAIFTPIAFLIGLIPAFSDTAKNLAMKLFHAFYMKLALAFLMTVYFSISAMVYNTMNPKEGYLLLFAIQIICAIAVWVKRHEIINVVTKPFARFNVNNNAGQSIKEYKSNYFKAKSYLKKATNPLTNSKPLPTLAERTGYNKLKASPGVGVVNPMTHPGYLPKERKAPAAAAPTTIPASAPAKQPVKQVVAAAPVERTPETSTKNVPKSLHPQPKLDDRANLESLERTLEKGGHAHRVNENPQPVQLKQRKTVKDQLSERKTVNQEAPKLHDRPIIKNWSDRVENRPE